MLLLFGSVVVNFLFTLYQVRKCIEENILKRMGYTGPFLTVAISFATSVFAYLVAMQDVLLSVIVAALVGTYLIAMVGISRDYDLKRTNIDESFFSERISWWYFKWFIVHGLLTLIIIGSAFLAILDI